MSKDTSGKDLPQFLKYFHIIMWNMRHYYGTIDAYKRTIKLSAKQYHPLTEHDGETCLVIPCKTFAIKIAPILRAYSKLLPEEQQAMNDMINEREIEEP
tara:strand:- start:587 stop:883 length:297 start_codon:yes stop_codon:yes gene_type:complete